MRSELPLSESVRIAPRFRRSIQLEGDLGDPSALEGYIVSPLAFETIFRIVDGMVSPRGNRAWTLVGPYGSGKSSLLLTLTSLIGPLPMADSALATIESQWPERCKELARRLDAMADPWLPVVVTGQRMPLHLALLRSLERAARGFWSGRGNNPDVLDRLVELTERAANDEPIEDAAIVDATVELAGKVVQSKQSGSGLLLVIDELGKLLEWAARANGHSDIYLLQLLAEACTRSSSRRGVTLVTTLHQSLEAYSEGLPHSVREEWAKVEGRFELIPYLESARHMIKLVAGAVDATPTAEATSLFGRLRRSTRAWLATQPEDADELSQCLQGAFPLHPFTAMALGPLFRQRFGQNERSLFAFLASREPFGFQSYLDEVRGRDTDRPYRLSELYDYVVTNTGVRVLSSSSSRNWAAAEQALARLPKDAEALDAELVKTIALLSLVGLEVGLRADGATLARAVEEDETAVEAALERLSGQSVVVYRKFRRAYHIWDGSDLDVPQLLRRCAEKVRAQGGFAARLQKLFRPYPIVASRHYHHTGTLRHLMPRYIPVPSGPNQWPKPSQADADLFLIVPDRLEQLEGGQRLLQDEMQWPGDRTRPMVVALPTTPEHLLEAIVDFFAVVEALKTTPELAGDPVAKRELQERRLSAEHALTDALAIAFGGASGGAELQWYRDGQLLSTRARPSAAASDLFDEVYPDCPHILNELVNRTSISSAAAAARRELMERMLTRGSEERLGIEGFPAELSLYRSVLEVTRLHQLGDDGWQFGEPAGESALRHIWSCLDEWMERARGERVDLHGLMRRLAAPPFGIREGVAPILLLAYFITRQERLFLYEDNTFIPSPADDLVARLLKKPQSFEFQLVETDGDTRALIQALGERLYHGQDHVRELTFLSIVRDVVRLAARLSDYASRTQRIAERARKVRSAIKAARDPVKLLLVRLPEAVGLDSFLQASPPSDDDIQQFADRLYDALRELSLLDRRLRDRIDETLRRLFASDTKSADFYDELVDRAQHIEGSDNELLPILRRFVSLTTSLSPTANGNRHDWLEAVATAVTGKPPSSWTDNDIARFEHRAMEVCRAFLASEELLLERRAANGAQTQMIRVSVLDDRGHEQHGVAVLRADVADRVERFRRHVDELALKSGIANEELAFAVISSMMRIAQNADRETREAHA